MAVAYSKDSRPSFADIFTDVLQDHIKIPFVAADHVLYDWTKYVLYGLLTCREADR